MTSWNEKNTLRSLREAEEVETFEAPDTKGLGPKAQKIGNMYQSLLDFGDNLPKQISLEDYLEAKRALKKLWVAMSGKTTSQIKNGIHFIRNGEYPKEGDFITFFDFYMKQQGLSDDLHHPYDWLSGTSGEKAKYLEYKNIGYVHAGVVYLYHYFPEAEGTSYDSQKLQRAKTYLLTDIIKWKKDSSRALSKVPEDILKEIKRDVDELQRIQRRYTSK